MLGLDEPTLDEIHHMFHLKSHPNAFGVTPTCGFFYLDIRRKLQLITNMQTFNKSWKNHWLWATGKWKSVSGESV